MRVVYNGGVQLDSGHFCSVTVDTDKKIYSLRATAPAVNKWANGMLGTPSPIDNGMGALFSVSGEAGMAAGHGGSGTIKVYAPSEAEPRGAVEWSIGGWEVTRRAPSNGQTLVQG